jgi:hypothetical protein
MFLSAALWPLAFVKVIAHADACSSINGIGTFSSSAALRS